jgi:hypothetical protein
LGGSSAEQFLTTALWRIATPMVQEPSNPSAEQAIEPAPLSVCFASFHVNYARWLEFQEKSKPLFIWLEQAIAFFCACLCFF